MRVALLSFVILLLSTNTSLFSQEKAPVIKKSNKGRFYAFWGWNKGWYTDSDIRFKGNNYNFKLNDVEATDRQTPFNFNTYFHPSTITIPQTNLRLGYFINDNIDISIGVDHMKYVLRTNQETEITGTINEESIYDGTYDNDAFIVSKDFLEFEHTDGLNYLNVEITYNKDLLTLLKIPSNPNIVQLNYLLGFGVGAMMPKSNVTLLNNERHDEFHFAGYGLAAKTGLDLILFKHFFLRSEYKGGFIHLVDIRTTSDESDKARQRFLFSQINILFGVTFYPFKSRQ